MQPTRTDTAARQAPDEAAEGDRAGSSTLAATHPWLAAELAQPDLGDRLTPGSDKQVAWRCSRGHEWTAAPYARTRGTGCPYCSGRRVRPGDNDLATTHPRVAADLVVPEQAYEVTAGSHRRLAWRCAEGHEWTATVANRARGAGCPFCSGRLPIPGRTDLATTHPRVADQLVDRDLATQLTAGSHRRVTWRCPSGHVWEGTVYGRSHARAGCPHCERGTARPFGAATAQPATRTLTDEAAAWRTTGLPRPGQHPRTGQEPPRWLRDVAGEGARRLTLLWGEDPWWGWSLPWLWAAVGGLATQEAPQVPGRETHTALSSGYWTAALHLMRYGMGWQYPGHGLLTWVAAGRPRATPSLTLLDDIWARDGQLEWLAAWLVNRELSGQTLCGEPARSRRQPVPGLAAWIDSTRRDNREHGIRGPLATDSADPLRLADHCCGPLAPPRTAAVAVPGSGQARTLVLDSALGWYRSLRLLRDEGGTPVSVTMRGLGWIGPFVRSPATGVWHLDAPGADEWHLAGSERSAHERIDP